MSDQQKDKITEGMTPVGQANYVFIASPKEDEDNPGKWWYSLMLAWPKSYLNTELLPLRQQATLAAQKFFGNPIPPLQPFLRDGDNPEHNTSNNPDLHGKVYLNIKCKCEDTINRSDAPGIVDRNGNPLMPIDVYSGAFVRCSVLLGGYNNKGKRGIWVRLQNIQKSHDGERLSGRPTAQSQFGTLDGPAPVNDPSGLL